jgi:hypothetical protein
MFFTTSDNILDIQKPYRILISLLDKIEIGPPIVVELFVDILISLKLHVDQHIALKKEVNGPKCEKIKSYHIRYYKMQTCFLKW